MTARLAHRALGFALGAALAAASAPAAPVAAQNFDEFIAVPRGTVALTNAKVFDGSGAPARTGQTIVIEGDRITAVGRTGSVDVPSGARVIDLSGQTVIPGLVGLHNHSYYTGGNGRAAQLSFSGSRLYLASGVTTARLLHGSANTIGGQDAVVKLRYGDPAAAHIIDDAPQGVKFALGENVKRRGDRFPNTRMGVEATLKRSFYEGLAYRREWQKYEAATKDAENGTSTIPQPRRDLRLEELVDIIEGRSFIHCHCYRADEILMLLSTADELGIRVRSLQHVLEGYKIAPEIAAHGASCSTFSDWWAYKIEAYDATPFNATALWNAGINIVVKSDDPESMRHLPLEAAKSLRYGNMPEHAALQMVTLNAARELGLDDRIGSLEVGKEADVAVFNGHPFNPFSRCELTVIDGRVRFQRSRQPTAMSRDSRQSSV